MPSAAQVALAVETYASTFQARDRDAWLDCFTPDAVHVDPVTSPPNEGRSALAAFWDRTATMADRFTLEVRAVHVCGGEAAVEYTLSMAHDDGPAVTVDGVYTLSVDDQGQISSLRAYWNPAALRQTGSTSAARPRFAMPRLRPRSRAKASTSGDD
jgi:steroid delta-isomerase